MRDADVSQDKWPQLYAEVAPRRCNNIGTPAHARAQVVLAMHTMWNKCKLVHGDLSEYNIL